MAIGEQQLIGKTITCDQCSALPPNDLDHPVSSFMNDFISRWNHAEGSALTIIEHLFKSHPLIWNDERYRGMVVSIMIRIGTNHMLLKDGANLGGAITLAHAIVVLQNYDSKDCIHTAANTATNCRATQTKTRDLNTGTISDKRDCLKFYSKRVSCSCLKALHQITRKTLPKLGFCYYCDEVKDRIALPVCSRCMITQYCSRDCQLADWPEHKRGCDMYVNAHAEQTANESK